MAGQVVKGVPCWPTDTTGERLSVHPYVYRAQTVSPASRSIDTASLGRSEEILICIRIALLFDHVKFRQSDCTASKAKEPLAQRADI